MKSEYVAEILDALRFMYPNLTITITSKDNESRLVVSSEQTRDRILLKYNTEFMDMQVDESGPDYIKLLIRQFSELIEKKYIKKLKRLFKSTPGVLGRPPKVLNKAQLEYAIANSKSCRGAARMLGVHVDTFRKYCDMFDTNLYLNHRNKDGIGISKGGFKEKVALEDIFSGKNVNFKVWWLKDRLIKDNLLEERCAQCGYDERRVTDGKIPLILDFKDGDTHNRQYENLRFLCYNCKFQVAPTNSKKSVIRLKEIKELHDMEKGLFEKEVDDKLFDEFNQPPVENTVDIFDKFNK